MTLCQRAFWVLCACGGAQILAPAAYAVTAAHNSGLSAATLETLWRARQAKTAHGPNAEADRLLDDIITQKARAGASDWFAGGEALARQSLAWDALGHAAAARSLADKAQAMAPHHLAPLVAQARLAWADKRWDAVYGTFVNMGALFVYEPPLLRSLVCQIGQALCLGAVAAWVLLAWSLALRVRVMVLHDLGHILPTSMSFVTRFVVALLMGAAVLSLRLGPIGVSLVLLIMCVDYVGHRQRLTLCCALFLATLAVVAMPETLRSWSASATLGEARYLAVRDIGAWRSVARIEATPVPHALDHWALGIAYKNHGELMLAAKHLKAAADARVASPHLYTELGNVAWASSRPVDAVDAYQKALQLDRNDAFALFNVQQAYLSLAQPREAEKARARANAISAARLADLADSLERSGQGVATPPVAKALLDGTDDGPDEHEQWRQATKARGAAQLFLLVGGLCPRPLAIVAMLASLAWMIRPGRDARRRILTTTCVRCRSAVCYVCAPNIAALRAQAAHLGALADLCEPCLKGLDADDQAACAQRIEVAVQNRRTWSKNVLLRRTLGVLLPGMGLMLRGFFGLGAAIALVVVSLIFNVLSLAHVTLDATPVWSLPFGPIWGLGFVRLVMACLLAAAAVLLWATSIFFGRGEEV